MPGNDVEKPSEDGRAEQPLFIGAIAPLAILGGSAIALYALAVVSGLPLVLFWVAFTLIAGGLLVYFSTSIHQPAVVESHIRVTRAPVDAPELSVEENGTGRELYRFRAALDGSSDGVLITDGTGVPVYINAVFGNWFGYTADDLNAIDLDAVIGAGRDFQSTLRDVVDGQPIGEDIILSSARGRRFPAHLRGNAILGDNFEVIGVFFLYTDITQQKQWVQELKRLSHNDGLTGVHNRRAFDEMLTQEWARARREMAELSLILIDIDSFKSYNDRYGHPAGDRCLKKVAGVIVDTFKRPGDFVARYSGEIFAVIVADSTGEAVATHAERLRSRVQSLALPHASSIAGSTVTISVGLSTLRPDGTNDPGGFVDSAERALYRAKDTGRNRVCQELLV